MNLRFIVALSCIGAALCESEIIKCSLDIDCHPNELCGPGICLPKEVVEGVKRCINTPCVTVEDCWDACHSAATTECASIFGESFCVPDIPEFTPEDVEGINEAIASLEGGKKEQAKKARNASPYLQPWEIPSWDSGFGKKVEDSKKAKRHV